MNFMSHKCSWCFPQAGLTRLLVLMVSIQNTDHVPMALAPHLYMHDLQNHLIRNFLPVYVNHALDYSHYLIAKHSPFLHFLFWPSFLRTAGLFTCFHRLLLPSPGTTTSTRHLWCFGLVCHVCWHILAHHSF